MSNPIARAAKENRRVQVAMQRLTEAAEELYQALGALGAETPRLGRILPSAVGPSLCEEAVQQGRARAADTNRTEATA